MTDPLYAHLRHYTIPTHPNVDVNMLLELATGKRRMLVSGGTREERDDAKIWLNECLATGHFPAVEWLDADDVFSIERTTRDR